MWGRGFTLFPPLSPSGWWFIVSRFTRWASLALSTLMLAGAFIIATPSGPAMALGTCPPGAPPMSTLCSPAGFIAMQGAYDTAKGVAIIRAGTATTAAAAGAFSVYSATESNGDVWDSVMGVDQYGVTEVGITYNPDVDPGYLELVESGIPGWDGGQVASWTMSQYGNTVSLGVVQTPTYGGTGVIQLERNCSGPDKYGYQTVVHYVNGSSQTSNTTFCHSNYWDSDQLSVIAVSTSSSLGGLSHVEFWDGSIYRPPLSPDRFEPSGGSGIAGEMVANLYCVAPGVAWVVTPHVELFGFTANVGAGNCQGTGPGGETGVLNAFDVTHIGSDGTQTSVFDYTAPSEVSRIPTEFPNCLDGGAECTLQLWKITQGQAEQWCGNAAVGCPDWWASDAKADHYQCRYGNYTVELGACSVYRNPGQVSPNTGVTFLEDGTMVSGGTVTSLNPDDYADLDRLPDTGVGTVPGWQPQPDTGTGTNPGPGPGPGTGTGAGSQPISDNQNCIPSGWGIFNPIEWVYVPVKCALEWAFVPQTPLNVGTFKESLDTSTVGQVNVLVADLFEQDWTGSNMCLPILRVNLDVLQMNELNINTCHPIVEGLSPIIRTGLIVLVFVIGAGVFANAVLLGFDIQALQTIKGARGD